MPDHSVSRVCFRLFISIIRILSQLQKAYTYLFSSSPTPTLYHVLIFSLNSVDPVVGPHGRIYERERLYLHLQICGCDPVSKKPASALSYTCSPVAARLAKEVARHYGARLEPF